MTQHPQPTRLQLELQRLYEQDPRIGRRGALIMPTELQPMSFLQYLNATLPRKTHRFQMGAAQRDIPVGLEGLTKEQQEAAWRDVSLTQALWFQPQPLEFAPGKPGLAPGQPWAPYKQMLEDVERYAPDLLKPQTFDEFIRTQELEAKTAKKKGLPPPTKQLTPLEQYGPQLLAQMAEAPTSTEDFPFEERIAMSQEKWERLPPEKRAGIPEPNSYLTPSIRSLDPEAQLKDLEVVRRAAAEGIELPAQFATPVSPEELRPNALYDNPVYRFLFPGASMALSQGRFMSQAEMFETVVNAGLFSVPVSATSLLGKASVWAGQAGWKGAVGAVGKATLTIPALIEYGATLPIKGAAKLWEAFAKEWAVGRARLIADLIARAAAGQPIREAELDVLTKPLDATTAKLVKEFVEDAAPQALKDLPPQAGVPKSVPKAVPKGVTPAPEGITPARSLRDTLSRLVLEKDVRIILPGNLDYEVAKKMPFYTPIFDEAAGLFTKGYIVTADRINKIGLHELGHAVWYENLPQAIRVMFRKSFQAFTKTEQGEKVLAPHYIKIPGIMEGWLTKDEGEMFAEMFKRAAMGKTHKSFNSVIKALDAWLRDGAVDGVPMRGSWSKEDLRLVARVRGAAGSRLPKDIEAIYTALDDIYRAGPIYGAAEKKLSGSSSGYIKPDKDLVSALYRALSKVVGADQARQMRFWHPSTIRNYLDQWYRRGAEGVSVRGARGKLVAADAIGANIRSTEPSLTPTQTVMEWWDNFVYQFSDDNVGFKRAKEILERAGYTLESDEDFTLKIATLSGNARRAYAFLHFGTYRPDDLGQVTMTKVLGMWAAKVKAHFTGESLKAILKDVKGKEDLEYLKRLLAAKRIQELAKKGKPSGWAKAADFLDEAAENLGDDFTEKQLQKEATRLAIQEEAKLSAAAVKEINTEFPHLEAITQRGYKYSDALLQYLYDSGSIDKAMIALLRENIAYVPFHRVLEEAVTRPTGAESIIANVATAIKRYTGVEAPIYDPIENWIKNTHVFIGIAERNKAGQMLVAQVMKHPELELGLRAVKAPIALKAQVTLKEVLKGVGVELPNLTDDQLAKVYNAFRPNWYSNDQSLLTVMVKGKPKFFQVDDPLLAKSLLHLNRQEQSLFWQLLRGPARLFRTAATTVPEFIFKNPIRDQWSAFINSQVGWWTPWNPIRGLAAILRKDDLYKLYYMSGGGSAAMVSLDRDYLRLTSQELLRKHPQLTESFKWMQGLSETTEQLTRIGAFQKALKSGKTFAEAAIESREISLDFSKAGTAARAWNSIVPFFNANIRDISKMRQMMIEHPYRTNMRLLLSITLPSVVLELNNMNHPFWKHIPQYQKDLFWLFLPDVPDDWDSLSPEDQTKLVSSWEVWENRIVRIPKPFTYGMIYGSLVERFMEWMNGEDPEVFKEWANTFGKQSVLNLSIPPAIQAFIENRTNYSFFQEVPLVPISKQRLAPEEQSTLYTSETAKKLGELFKYPPAKIENLARGVIAGWADYALKTSDFILAKVDGIEPPPRPSTTLADFPFIKAFVVRDPFGSSDALLTRFYDTYNQFNQDEQTVESYLDADDTRKAAEYLIAHPKMGAMDWDKKQKDWYAPNARMFRTGVRYINDVRKWQKTIYASKTMSSEEKRLAIDYSNLVVSKIAKDTLDAFAQQK